MDAHEYEVAKHVAKNCLNFHIDFDNDGHVYCEMGGQKWEFKTKTDAEAIEEIAIIFNSVNLCMWEIVNESLLRWTAKNKGNFN